MTTKNIKTYNVRELKKVNKDAFDRILNKAEVTLQEFVEQDFGILYKNLIEILDRNYYNAQLKNHYDSYYVTITYEGDNECDSFYVIEDIKNNLDIENYPGYYVEDYLKNNFLDKNKNNDAVDYLTALFESLFKMENNEKYSYTEEDLIDFIDGNAEVFTINGIDIDTL